MSEMPLGGRGCGKDWSGGLEGGVQRWSRAGSPFKSSKTGFSLTSDSLCDLGQDA